MVLVAREPEAATLILALWRLCAQDALESGPACGQSIGLGASSKPGLIRVHQQSQEVSGAAAAHLCMGSRVGGWVGRSGSGVVGWLAGICWQAEAVLCGCTGTPVVHVGRCMGVVSGVEGGVEGSDRVQHHRQSHAAHSSDREAWVAVATCSWPLIRYGPHPATGGHPTPP